MNIQAQEVTYSKATYRSKYSPLTPCKSGTFLDATTSRCMSCPSGFKRTTYPANSPKACMKAVTKPKFVKATTCGGFHKDYPCSVGCFKDLATQKCWSCPKGYKRTIYAVNSSKACELAAIKSVEKEKKPAQPSGYYVAMTARIDNKSDWTIRYRFLYGNKTSGWHYVNAKTKGNKLGERIATHGLEVEWKDLTTWKKLGYTKKRYNNYQSRGTANIRVDAADSDIYLTITGSVFPPKAIKMSE